jgi:hypothetical protein
VKMFVTSMSIDSAISWIYTNARSETRAEENFRFVDSSRCDLCYTRRRKRDRHPIEESKMLSRTMHLLSDLSEAELEIAIADELAILDGQEDELVAALHEPETDSELTGFHVFDIDDWD